MNFFWFNVVTATASVVTSCTQRKSAWGRLDLVQLPQTREVERLAEAWRVLVSRAVPMGPAKSLYQGRSIADTAAAAAYLGASWYVVSAGLGLVRSDQLVPAYECTVVTGSELGSRLNVLGATATDWWNGVTSHQPYPLSRLVAQSPTLLALPSTYLRMVQDDLARVSPVDAERLRIFTSTAGVRCVPEHLVDCVMPYDDRLESLPNYAGTRSDFAQRALRHFVEALGAASLTLEEARAAVSEALAPLAQRRRVAGRRMSNDEIRRVLTEQWSQHGGSCTRLLRYLRDDARISCEQRRFSRIWNDLAAELGARR